MKLSIRHVEQVKKKQRIKSFFKGMFFLLPSIILFSRFLVLSNV